MRIDRQECNTTKNELANTTFCMPTIYLTIDDFAYSLIMIRPHKTYRLNDKGSKLCRQIVLEKI